MQNRATLPPPGSLLGVSKYANWYPGQEYVFRHVLDWYRKPNRFLGMSVPAGSGKSLNAILAAKMLGVRTCILTVTKGLQDQYMRDVSQIGGANVKGRNNFTCTLIPDLSCDDGPCHDGLMCNFRQRGCPYYDQLSNAMESDLVVTNYSYYLAQTNFSSGLGEFKLLVLDEAHLAFGAIENHVSIYLQRMDVEHMGITMPRREKEWVVWQQWASDVKLVAASVSADLERSIRELRSTGNPVPSSLSKASRAAKTVSVKLSAMSSASGRWVVQSRPHGYEFTPIWISDYGKLLYQQVPKIALMSALLAKKTMSVLGVPDGYSWLSTDSSFPTTNTPVWHVNTSPINHRSDDYKLIIWLSRIDQIIQRRLDRKGIVFTVSYDRAHLILRNSRYTDIYGTAMISGGR